VVRFYEKALKA
jgi:hypothetical protein